MSTSCEPSSRVIRDFSDVESLFIFCFGGFRLKPPNQKIINKARISSRVNKLFIDTAAGGIATSTEKSDCTLALVGTLRHAYRQVI